jgi:hypothetical protein
MTWAQLAMQYIAILRGTEGHMAVYGPVHILLVGSVLLIFLVFCVVFYCFVCLRPVSCVHNVASVSGLYILDFSFRLSLTLISMNNIRTIEW